MTTCVARSLQTSVPEGAPESVALSGRNTTRRDLTLGMAATLLACGLPLRTLADVGLGAAIVKVAQTLVEAKIPYREGGTDPAGFDCSGLVWYTHTSVGLDVPRTATLQRQAARPVPREALEAGDLLFYKVGEKPRAQVDHVGIFVVFGLIIHVSAHRKAVGYELYEYMEQYLVSTGRLWT